MNLSQIGEADLLAKTLAFDSQALAEVHDRFFSQIYRYAYLRTGQPRTAEDIASETFLRLLDALHGGHPPHTTLRGWLFGVASHLVADYYNGKREVELSETHPDGHSTQGEAEKKLQHADVQAAISQLTAEQQEVLALRFASGFSVEDTARMMNRTLTAVKALQFRAVTALRQTLVEVENE